MFCRCLLLFIIIDDNYPAAEFLLEEHRNLVRGGLFFSWFVFVFFLSCCFLTGEYLFFPEVKGNGKKTVGCHCMCV